MSRHTERERRQTFCNVVHDKLPFDLVGIHDTIPSIKSFLSVGCDANYPDTLERSDIESRCSSRLWQGLNSATNLDNADLMSVLENLERCHLSEKDNDIALVNTQVVRAKLEGLVSEMDDLETGFGRCVELSRK